MLYVSDPYFEKICRESTNYIVKVWLGWVGRKYNLRSIYYYVTVCEVYIKHVAYIYKQNEIFFETVTI